MNLVVPAFQASEPSGPQSLQFQIRPWPQKRLSINRLGLVHRQLPNFATASCGIVEGVSA
jgi:hypothetical protein